MIAIELMAAASSAVDHALHTLASTPLAEPAPKGIDTDNVVTFFASKIAPILLAVLGVIFIGRATLGSVGIPLEGLAFIAGAATLFFVGDYLINLIFE